jgi:hypothetical protein
VLEREAEARRDAICRTHALFKCGGAGILVYEEEEEEWKEEGGNRGQ